MGQVLLSSLQAAREDIPNWSLGGPAPNPRTWIAKLPNDPDPSDPVQMDPNPFSNSRTATAESKPIWYLFLRTLPTQQQEQMSQFLSPVPLLNSAVRVCNGLAAQMARKHFLTPIKESASGQIVHIEERLQIGVISFWMMSAIFLVLAACAVCILRTTPSNVIAQHPSSIATSASVLTMSPEVHNLLVPAGSVRTSQLTASLSDRRFVTLGSGGIGVDSTRPYTAATEKKPGPWIPLLARPYMMLLTLGAPLLVMIILEVVYAASKQHRGLVDVTMAESSATYLARYGSALIMFLIATSFNGLDFAVSFFAPYSLLRGGSVPAARGIDFHVLGSFPPKALYKSLKRKHWASALSNSAGTLGGVLTIISSGLWLVDRDVVQEMAIRLPLAHSWNATWPDSSLTGDGGAGVTFNTIQHGGAVMGPLIWDDYVLPDLSTGLTIESETQETLVGSSSNYTFQVQALRPHLLCEAIDNDRIKVYRNEKDGAYTDLEFLFPLEGHCRRGGRYGENAYYNVSYSIYAKSAGASLWFGKLIDLHLGPFHNRTVSDGSSNTTEETLEFGEPSYGPDNIVGCPSVGVVLGPFNVSDGKKKASEFTALLCSQKVEQVALDVTYLGNQTRTPTLVGSDGPRRIEGQSHYLTNGTQGFESFAYRVPLYIGNLSAINASHGENPFSQVDGFVDNIVSGPGGVPFEELQGKDNQDNLINAVQKLYNKDMSLAIDANFRQAYSTPEEAEFVTGKLRIMTSRLQVNFVSKLILQIILAVMTLMGGLAFWLADLRGSLPRKSTSIASTMGFLASSELCGSNGSASLIPKNAMQTEEKEFVNLFDGWLFSLGWWNTSTETDVEVVLDSGVVERAKKKRFGIDVGVPEQLGFRKRRRFQPA